ITVNASKATGQLRYRKKRLVGAQDTTYAIADIFRIETRKQWRMQNDPSSAGQGQQMRQPVLVAQSVIVFKDGREVALDHQKTSSTTSTSRKSCRPIWARGSISSADLAGLSFRRKRTGRRIPSALRPSLATGP